MASNTHIGNDLQLLPGNLGDRHKSDLNQAAFQLLGANGRNRKPKIHCWALLAMQHAPDERDRVQITHRAHADFRMVLSQPSVYRDRDELSPPPVSPKINVEPW